MQQPCPPYTSRFHERRWVHGGALTCVAHAALAAALILKWSPGVAPPIAPAAPIAVDLEPEPSSPQAAPQDLAVTPPKPAPAKPASPAHVPHVPRMDNVKADIVLPPDTQQTAAPTAPPQQTTSASQEGAPPPSPAPLSTESAAPDRAASLQAQAAKQTWEDEILARMEKAKRYPPEARYLHQEDTVFIRFTIDRDGRVRDAAVVRSRGYASLDDEVIALAKRVSPLPPPPKDVAADPVVEIVPVNFYMR